MPINPSSVVKFNFLMKVSIPSRTRLKRFLMNLFKEEGKRIEFINYIFCSDSYLLDINKRYLKHNYHTDIITFSLSNQTEAIVADIFISVDRVKDNSKEYGTSFKEELHRVIFHGALHLCGYDDKTPSQISTIRRREGRYLAKYFKSSVSRGTKQ
ncbi:MAG: rRNA maturation RNase YbeY [Bacteroidetes bacterium]|nr:rRNA maturation RNase YbeY [Bacteroidota bacterium]